MRHPYCVAFIAQRSCQGVADQGVIIDHQNAAAAVDNHLRDCF
jgi:hypothetical protein